MSHHSRQSRSRPATPGTLKDPSRRLRTIGACLTGLLLIATAFQAVASNRVAGLAPNYGPGGGGGDDSLGAGGIAGIVAGVGVGVAAISGLIGPGAAADECREPQPVLPDRLNQFSEIRLTPRETTLDAGECRCFFLEVQATEDKKWYSVTHSSTSTIELQEQTECVVKRDGSKNVFCVPIEAAKSCDGKSFTVVGTYTHAGQAPMTATARILVRVPQSDR